MTVHASADYCDIGSFLSCILGVEYTQCHHEIICTCKISRSNTQNGSIEKKAKKFQAIGAHKCIMQFKSAIVRHVFLLGRLTTLFFERENRVERLTIGWQADNRI